MAQDAPYKLSRLAMRERFGTRQIDGSAPQAAGDNTPSGRDRRNGGYIDTTPSGRMRERNQRGGPIDPGADDREWRKQFQQNDAANAENAAKAPVRPLDLMRRRAAPQSPLDAIRQANDTGAAFGAFKTPSGSVGFDRRAMNLMPEDGLPVASVADYLGTIGGSSAASLFPSLRPAARKPSILDGAQKWLGGP